MHRISKLSLVTCALSLLLIPAVAGRTPLEGAHPVVLAMSQQTLRPGTTITCEVDLDQKTDTNLVVSVGASDASLFSSLPSTVTVPAGEDHVSFQVTVATEASGYVSLSASANGESVYTAPTPIQIGVVALN